MGVLAANVTPKTWSVYINACALSHLPAPARMKISLGGRVWANKVILSYPQPSSSYSSYSFLLLVTGHRFACLLIYLLSPLCFLSSSPLLPSLNVFIYRATKSTLATSCHTMNLLSYWFFIVSSMIGRFFIYLRYDWANNGNLATSWENIDLLITLLPLKEHWIVHQQHIGLLIKRTFIC